MPLRPPMQPPTSSADWDRWARQVPVVPDLESVGEDQLKDNSITEQKYGDTSVSTRALADEAVSDSKLRNSSALSVIGRAQNTPGSPTDIAFGDDGDFLVRRGTQIVTEGLQDSDIPATIARDSEVATAVSAGVAAHEAASDPHPQYLTQTEGDARYREITDAIPYADITGLPAAFGLIFSGSGSPEGVVTAPVSATYHRSDGGAGTSFYVKESGAGNTGWVGK